VTVNRTATATAIATAAAAWALIFAVFHIVWALGFPIGLHHAEALVAFAKPWFLAYDLTVALMCIVAVPVALALGTPWIRTPRRLLLPLAWIGTTLLVLRAVASLIQVVWELFSGHFDVGIWEWWFYAGAVLFALNLRMFHKRALR
jgi:hypothetical protein